MSLFILFLYLFNFKITMLMPAFNSTFLIGIILFFYATINQKYGQCIIIFINKLLFKNIFILYSFLLSYSFLIIIIKSTYDFSYTKNLIIQFLYLVIGIFIFCYYYYKENLSSLITHIIYAFSLQSLVQIVSFLYPSINIFFNIFRYPNNIEKAETYIGGFRGLSISGSAFYGLSVGYGLIIILFIYNWNCIKINNIFFKYYLFFLIILGGIFSARTSLLGFVICLIYLFNKIIYKYIINLPILKIKIINKIEIKNIFILLILFSLFFYFIFIFQKSDSLNSNLNLFNKWAFQFFYNLQSKGTLTTSSTNVLFSEMYFPIPKGTLLFGDGSYIGSDGSYYMHTDAGYMRNILYFGITGLIILFIYQFSFFIWKDKKSIIRNIFIIIYISIVHIKGDSFGSNHLMQNILFLNFLCGYFKKNKFL